MIECLFNLGFYFPGGPVRLIFIALFIIAGTSAYAETDCAATRAFSGVIEINQYWNSERTACALTIAPRRTPAAQYRSFYVDSTGLFVVRNSYGPGPARTHLSYREFFVLPIKNYMPIYKVESNRDVTITLVSGHRLRLSGRDFSAVSFLPGQIQEKPLARDNNGGFEFILKDGFWFDGGYKTGVSPLGYPLASSVLRSSKSSPVISCRLTNQDYLDYKDENYLVRHNGEQLLEFLRYSCAQLEF